MGVVSTTEPQSPPPAEGVGEADDAAVPARRGTRGTVGDMLRTMLVVLAVVVGIVLLVPRPGQIARPAVNVAGAARGAEPALGFPPSVPQGLPAGWVPTSAETRNGTDGVRTWHIGYVTPSGLYAGVEQAAKVTDQWVAVNDAGGTPVASVPIDGVVWQQLEKPERDSTTLLLRTPGRVTLVTSKGGGLAEATVLARSLRISAAVSH
jgi:hypothetical protein